MICDYFVVSTSDFHTYIFHVNPAQYSSDATCAKHINAHVIQQPRLIFPATDVWTLGRGIIYSFGRYLRHVPYQFALSISETSKALQACSYSIRNVCTSDIHSVNNGAAISPCLFSSLHLTLAWHVCQSKLTGLPHVIGKSHIYIRISSIITTFLLGFCDFSSLIRFFHIIWFHHW